MRILAAQVRAEVTMTLKRGESLLLTLGIPLGILAFFSLVHVLPTGTKQPVSFLAPGVLALAIMSTAMVGLGIATGFERSYGVLKRLGTTPLGRLRLIIAKMAGVVVVEAIQAVALVAVALALGWSPGNGAGEAAGALLLATAAFGGIGLLMAGRLRAEVNLAAANGLYILLLLLGGVIVPVTKLPQGLADLANALPAAALSTLLHHALGGAPGGALGGALGGQPVQAALRGAAHGGAALRGAVSPALSQAGAWTVLAIWAVIATAAAALTFRWE